jgi:hypothetical protein
LVGFHDRGRAWLGVNLLRVSAAIVVQLYRMQTWGDGTLEPAIVQMVGFAKVLAIDIKGAAKRPDDNV